MDQGLPCVHCGLCLDTCPTYRVLGTEADSPRGRIYIMDAIEHGEVALDDETAGHLDGCLGCLACETACPSGVSFGRRIERFRIPLRRRRTSWVRSLWRAVLGNFATNVRLLSMSAALARGLDSIGFEALRRRVPGLGLMPAAPPRSDRTLTPRRRTTVAPPVSPRLRVALLTGCVAETLRPGISDAAVEVLHRNGIEVVDVPGQGCCGALAMHDGRPGEARAMARANIEAFTAADVDAIVTTAAGCNAIMLEYGRLFEVDLKRAGRAAQIAAITVDISEYLVRNNVKRARNSGKAPRRATVAYHDACHLVNVSGVCDAPRTILEYAAGHRPVDLGENAICCGSAGSYNIEHPAMAGELGRRKAELAKERGVGIVAVGNVGCLLQLEQAFARAGVRVQTAHPVELLAAAYRSEDA